MTAPIVSTTPLAELSALGTSVWLDQIRRSMIETGELERLVREDAVVGVTANPTIFEKAILGGTDYDERLAELTRKGANPQAIYETLAVEDVQGAADVLRPVYEETDGRDGYVSLEVAPELAHDTEGTVAAAAGFWERLGRPNVMIKIPGSEEGLEAIRRSIAAGINVNVTLLFSVAAYEQVAEAYIAGLEERADQGEPLDAVASVASFFVSRVDTAVDRLLLDAGRTDLIGRAAIANARIAYGRFQAVFGSERFAALRERGARPQRPLWASTGVKTPNYSDTMYVEELAGPDTVNTMPMATLLAFQNHGRARDTLSGRIDEARGTLSAIEAAGISLAGVTAQLLTEGIESFDRSMQGLLAGIERRRTAVVAERPSGVEAALSEADAERIARRLSWGRKEDVARRVWGKDHTLWGAEPEEISDRLGWLAIAEQMADHVGELEAFADEVRAAGFTHCALLGMGGSSLAPEVMRRTFGVRAGYLELRVLDSTHPDAVAALAGELPLERTLFLIPTKSGGTLETVSLYRYFRSKVADPGRFVTITDPDTSLAALAQREGFRRIFLGAPDIGGRYSALSNFGLVPAALMGSDVRGLLERAEVAVHATQPSAGAESFPLWLGLALGELARAGRDKLTFVVSEPIESFGLWLEQLVAESTGKHGAGIVPIVGEPLGDPDRYGEDRLFVHLRREGQDDERPDRALAALAGAGHPVLTIPFDDALDLGSLFFTWEFAVAVAGSVLAVNPFDEPNVSDAKDATAKVLAAYAREGRLPFETPDAMDGEFAVFGAPGAATAREALASFLGEAEPPSYVATMAYAPASDAADVALDRLRTAIRDARRVATTVGYGPRLLHSTGQLHKGGPPTGRFLQVTTEGRGDVEVPAAGYGFNTLIQAQAVGDRRALRARGVPVLHVRVAGDPAVGLRRLGELVAEVLS